MRECANVPEKYFDFEFYDVEQTLETLGGGSNLRGQCPGSVTKVFCRRSLMFGQRQNGRYSNVILLTLNMHFVYWLPYNFVTMETGLYFKTFDVPAMKQ